VRQKDAKFNTSLGFIASKLKDLITTHITKKKKKKKKETKDCSSVAEPFCSISEALCSMPSNAKENKT
jgi:hypothetical protein